jgi:hypothetical protein
MSLVAQTTKLNAPLGKIARHKPPLQAELVD